MRIWLLLTLVSCGTGEQGAPQGPEPGAEPADAVITLVPAPLPTPTEPKYASTHVLIAWNGAVRAPATAERTEEQARALAESLRQRALAGEDLEALAREHSDGPSAPRGGRLGVYLTGTMVPEFEAAVASVAVGEIGPLARTPFGWHVVRRDAVVEAEVAHIVVSWKGAWRSSAERSQEEARARIEEARTRLEAGADFGEVARAYSDGPTAETGGDLGTIAPGQMIPAFEDVAFALPRGQLSEVVETPYGFHLILRR